MKKLKNSIKKIIIKFFSDPFYEVIFFQILSLCGTILFGLCMFFPGLHIYVKKTFFLSLQIFISISAIELGAFFFCKFQILEKILKIITKGKEATLRQAILFSVVIFIFLLLLLIVIERIATGNFF